MLDNLLLLGRTLLFAFLTCIAYLDAFADAEAAYTSIDASVTQSSVPIDDCIALAAATSVPIDCSTAATTNSLPSGQRQAPHIGAASRVLEVPHIDIVATKLHGRDASLTYC